MFNVLMSCHLIFMTWAIVLIEPRSDVSSRILTASVVLDDAVQGVRHQFARVAVPAGHCEQDSKTSVRALPVTEDLKH